MSSIPLPPWTRESLFELTYDYFLFLSDDEKKKIPLFLHVLSWKTMLWLLTFLRAALRLLGLGRKQD
jgi:hypothetical protein